MNPGPSKFQTLLPTELDCWMGGIGTSSNLATLILSPSDRPGPNIPLICPNNYSHFIHPIIQDRVSYLFFLFLKKADKMQMKHKYDQNVHVYFDQQVLDYIKFSLYCKF